MYTFWETNVIMKCKTFVSVLIMLSVFGDLEGLIKSFIVLFRQDYKEPTKHDLSSFTSFLFM